MTRKHFEDMASRIRRIRDKDGHDVADIMAHETAEFFDSYAGRFKRDLYLAKCGVTEPV